MWRLQGGSYIPGFSRQAYGAGLERDVTKTRKDQAKKAAKLNKYMSKRQMIQKWGGRGLKSLGVPSVVGDIGGYGLSKLFGGKAPEVGAGSDGTGLLGSGYEELSEASGGIEKSMLGRLGGSMLSSLSGAAGDKLGAQLGDMFGKWKAGRTGLSGYEGTGMGNVLGLDATGAERFSPGMKLFEDPASMTGYGGFGMNPAGGAGGLYSPAGEAVSSAAGGAGDYVSPIPSIFAGANDPYGVPIGSEYSVIPEFQSGGALGKAFGLNRPSFNTGSRVSDDEGWISEYKPGQTKGWMAAVDELASDTDTRRKDLDELGGMGDYEESMIERIKGAAGSMFNPFHGVEKESPMQRYAKLSPKSMSLLEEYGGKDEPEREPFDLMGKLGGLGRGAGNVLSSVINPFHGMERESPRSAWTGQPMQQGGMMPGGVSNALPYQEGGSTEQSLMDMVNRSKQAQTERDSLNTLYSQPMDRFSPDESFTREVLLRNLGLPQETDIDTLYHSGNDIGLSLTDPSGGSYKYNRSGNMTDKRDEFNRQMSNVDSNLRSDMLSARKGFRSNYPQAANALSFDLTKDEYQGALDKLRDGYVDMDAFERMDYERGQKSDDEPEETSYQKMKREMDERRAKAKKSGNFDSFFDELDGFQMGGSISPYNLGGSVTQQPMAYQLGGLLKYKRSPTMG